MSHPIRCTGPRLLSTSGIVLTILITAVTSNPLVAQSVPPAEGQSSGTGTALMSDLLEQMQSDRFAQRSEASRRLRQLGTKAHQMLAEIVQSGDSESATRALDLLQQAAQDSNLEIASSARRALVAIAKAGGLQARRARNALQPPDPMPLQPLPAIQAPVAPGPPQAFAPMQRTNLRISIRTSNGVRDVEVVQNDRKFRFRDAGAGIETERPGKQGGIKKQTYKDIDELRREDPEAYQVYQKAGIVRTERATRPDRTLPALPPDFGQPMPPGFGPGGVRRPLPPSFQPMPQLQPTAPTGPRLELHPELTPVPARKPNAPASTKPVEV
ncbi:hypothetical protein NHH03_14985 [Stieleria sp. TO1_6]|uniref:hypothetical protein n=1 Tax=Stieleria tagensis TaxID=2956795 RepID=UPI00209B05DB|nr:hypothetical protein [Stieleria tagensis]MCO8123050.1 hypothetical protein [Stieleria tagensis]